MAVNSSNISEKGVLHFSPQRGEKLMAVQDADWVRDLYAYDAESGVLTWRRPPRRAGRNAAVAGSPAGKHNKRANTLTLRVGGKDYPATHVIWLYVHGQWPDRQVHYLDAALPLPEKNRLSNLRLVGVAGDVLIEEIRGALAYDPATGEFRWRVTRRGVKAGAVAGTVKTINGHLFRYIRINGVEHSAGRLAWLLHYGEWPKARLEFKDGDGSNCRIGNLVESRFSHGTRQDDPLTAEEREGRRRETYQRHDLKRDYGISVDDYAKMLAAQNGVCALCSEPETGILRGRLRRLAVDHDHKTGVVRELLCQKCNSMVENARERPDLLRAAAAYLERHALPDNVLPLKGGK
jgi:hypothetical protein